VNVKFNLTCFDISSLINKEGFFLKFLLLEIEVNKDFQNMMNVVEENKLF